ncbi:hypothetical protein K9U36_22010 [Escherichia coli]|nr:hypothetical protein [Escherichia coli]UAX45294.1 hypothetical protein K9U36_22010 [Escherichia coli]
MSNNSFKPTPRRGAATLELSRAATRRRLERIVRHYLPTYEWRKNL